MKNSFLILFKNINNNNKKKYNHNCNDYAFRKEALL